MTRDWIEALSPEARDELVAAGKLFDVRGVIYKPDSFKRACARCPHTRTEGEWGRRDAQYRVDRRAGMSRRDALRRYFENALGRAGRWFNNNNEGIR